jgi:sulfate permease, SulP family
VLFASLRGYRLAWLSADVLAGLLLAVLAIPSQMATARLAQMPPEAGIVAFIAGSLVFAVFGRNRFLSVGADSTIAPIFAVTIAGLAAPDTREYGLLLGLVALLVGALLVAAGTLHAEWISDLLSIPVTVGFLAGIAIQITISQLPSLLGVSVTQTAAIPRLGEVIRAIPHANAVDFGIGIGVLALMLIARAENSKIPGTAIALVLAGIATVFFHLHVAVVGALTARLPQFTLPAPSDAHLGQIIPLAIVIAVVCTVQTVTTLRIFRSEKGIVNPSRDLAATGAGSLVAGFFGAFPVDASPPLTALRQSTGARSQLAGLVALFVAILYAIFGGSLTRYVPVAAFAGVLIYIASQVLRWGEIRRIFRESRLESLLVLLAAVLVVALPINVGMMLSILLSLLYGVYVMLRPPCGELVHVPDTTIWWPPSAQEKGERIPGVVVFAPSAPLYFMNARYITERLGAAVELVENTVKTVVIECSGVTDIDYTGAHVSKAAVRSLQERGLKVGIARLSDLRAVEIATRSGLLEQIGSDHVFKSVDEAVQALS